MAVSLCSLRTMTYSTLQATSAPVLQGQQVIHSAEPNWIKYTWISNDGCTGVDQFHLIPAVCRDLYCSLWHSCRNHGSVRWEVSAWSNSSWAGESKFGNVLLLVFVKMYAKHYMNALHINTVSSSLWWGESWVHPDCKSPHLFRYPATHKGIGGIYRQQNKFNVLVHVHIMY